VGKQTCMIPRDLHHTPSMAAYKMICLKFELACESSIARMLSPFRLSVRLSDGWIIQKRLKLGLCNFHHTVAPSL